MRTITSVAIGILCLICSSVSLAQTVSTTPTSVTVIPERTEVFLAVEDDMKSGDIKEGEEVRYTVSRDVSDPQSHVLIKAGWPAYGVVNQSKRRGIFGKSGKLAFSCDYILAPDGTKIALRGKAINEYGRDNRTASVLTAIFFSPVGALINGKDVTVRKGDLYKMYVDKTVTLTPKITRPEKNIFVMNSGKSYVGTLSRINGDEMVVSTDMGEQKASVSELAEVQPYQEITGSAPTKNLFLTKSDKAYVGALVRFKNGVFTIISDDSEVVIKADELKSAQVMR